MSLSWQTIPVILIGQYDSPFVRRVGIALSVYGLAFEQRRWSAFGDADKLAVVNPLARVPALVLDDGDVLVDSHAMLDYLDSLVPTKMAMFPREEPARRRAVKIAMLASGVADKAVALFYEQRMHREASAQWAARCSAQIRAGLAALEADRAARPGDHWFGGTLGHEDIAVAAMWRFACEAHGGLIAANDYPALARHAAFHEALAVFQKISQPFLPPV